MLPPTIPTSFVPHSTAGPTHKFGTESYGILGLFIYVISGVTFLLAAGVFLYGRILISNQASEDAQLAKVEASIDPSTAQNFVRLRDRLASGQTLLNNHLAFSEFFTLLGTLMPTTVRFTSLHLSLDDKGNAKFEGSGIAKNFNSLAAVSAAFAQNGRVKDAIFSNIVVSQKDSSVSFALIATLDPKLITFLP